jgi:trk system potassium uptake protein TrkH
VPVVTFFFAGLIGGCAGSTSCSIKVFRYQLLFASVSTQVRRLYAPHGIFEPRYDGPSRVGGGRVLGHGVLRAVLRGARHHLGSSGPDRARRHHLGLGRGGGAGQYRAGPWRHDRACRQLREVNDTAKWILAMAMLFGRLELIAVLVLFTAAFWRA